MIRTVSTHLALCVFLRSVSLMQLAKYRDSRVISFGSRHFHKEKYKWWSIRDDFLNHFLKSLTNSVTSSWITWGTFHNAKSLRHNYKILCNGTQSDVFLSWGVGLLQVQLLESHLFRSKSLVQDVVLSGFLIILIPTLALETDMWICISKMHS